MTAPELSLDFGGPVDVPFECWGQDELSGGVLPRFQRIAARFPDRLAVADCEGEWTYAELAHIAGGVQRSLKANGQPVAIEIPNSRWLVAAMLGALAAARPYVPVDPSHPISRNRRIQEHSGADFTISRSWIEGLRGAPIEPGATGRDVACILYTSGSTGQPKGVYQNQRNLMHDVMQYTHSVHISPEDRLTMLYSGATVGAVRDIFGALLNGASLHIHDLRGEGMGPLRRQLRDGLITIYHSVPPVFRALAELPGRFSGNVRLVYLAGDRVVPGDFELFAGRFGQDSLLYTGIGCTECWTIYRQWFLRPGMAISGPLLPVGRAIPDRTMRLHEDGEIWVTSRYLALGYWRDPELTAARFAACPADPEVRTFRTGDRGREREDGLLEYLGRADQQVKVRGYRIELAEIESAMLPATAAVTLHEGTLTAFYEGPRQSDWPERLAAKLPPYMIPARFVWVEKLPTLANHKLDRGAIATLARHSAPVERSETATASGGMEAAICGAFAEVLGRSNVGPDDDFFALGGNSLGLLQLSSRLEQLGGRAVAVNPLQSARTPRALAVQFSTPIEATEPELYYLPGLDGGLAGLEALLPALPCPAQALRYPSDLSLQTIPAIASWIRRSLPPRRTPYRLLGYSFGGRVGFELARQLTAAGAKVGFLGIIDTPASGELARRPVPVFTRVRSLLHLATATHPRQWPAAWRYRAGRRKLAASPFVIRNREAFRSYAPQPWDGEVTLVRCSGELLGWDPADEFLGWDELCQRVVVHRFEGTHNVRDPLVTPSLIRALTAAMGSCPGTPKPDHSSAGAAAEQPGREAVA